MNKSTRNDVQSLSTTRGSSPLRLAVVAHTCNTAGGLSVGRSLVSSLHRIAPENVYLFLLPANAGYEELGLDESRHRVIYRRRNRSLPGRWWFDTFGVKRILGDFRPDVVLSLATQGTGIRSCPQAILCHDPHMFYPTRHFGVETLSRKLIKRYLKWKLANDLRHTQLLLCQTSVTQTRLRDTFHYTGKTAICPNAVARRVTDVAETSDPEPLAPYAGKVKLFCLTRYYPHKNLERIVDVFARYREELCDVVVVLTIAADQHVRAGRLLRRIHDLGLSDVIVNVGLLRQSELAGYYSSCQALFLPTLLESFSGTYLEAMHFGVPILTSDLDFAHDVCGPAALYFDPWNTEAIKNAIVRFKSDPSLAHDLASKGETQLRSKFASWDQIAKTLLADLHSIVRKEPVSA